MLDQPLGHAQLVLGQLNRVVDVHSDALLAQLATLSVRAVGIVLLALQTTDALNFPGKLNEEVTQFPSSSNPILYPIPIFY